MNPVALRVACAALVPILASILYFGVIASDMYVSTSSVVVRSGNTTSTGLSLGGILPLPGGNGQDVIVVADYISSMEMARHLDSRFELRQHYSDPQHDLASRLKANASDEDYLKYLGKMIRVVYEETTEIIAITVRTFEPELARDVNAEIILKSEALINDLSDRIASDTLGLAQNELQLAIANAKSVSERLSRFTSRTESYDPGAETNNVLGLIASLEAKLAETRALFAEKSAYLRESSAEMRSIKNRIAGYQTELRRERERLSNDNGKGVGDLLEDYKPLQIEEELARQRYAAALTALESARKESQQQKRYLATFVQPGLPSSSTEPDRLVDAICTVLLALLMYAIFALLRAAVREHVDFAH